MDDIILQKKHLPKGKIKYDVEMYLINRQQTWTNMLKRTLLKHKSLKFDIKIVVKLQKLQDQHVMIYSKPCFRAPNQTILAPDSIWLALERAKENILSSYDSYMKDGSGWTLHSVEFSETSIYKFQATGGGGKIRWITRLLPEKFARHNKASIVTFPPTPDNKCFLYCILASLYPPKTSRQVNDPRHYVLSKKIRKVNTDGLSYPTPLHQIPKFSSQNGLRINVFGLDGKNSLYFLHHGGKFCGHKVINLLLHKNHYHLVKSWNPFVKGNSHTRKLCMQCGKLCLSRYMREAELCNNCKTPPICGLIFPEEGTTQKFQNFSKMQFCPFVLYCDLETSLQQTNEEKSVKVKKKKVHQALAIGLLRTSYIPTMSHGQPKIFVGEDCIEQFFKHLREEINCIETFLSETTHPIHMSKEDETAFKNSKECYVCGKSLSKQKKIRDHDHYLPRNNYRGASCNTCNLNRMDSRIKVPMFFHNGGRFDMHFLIQKLHTLSHGNINMIAKTAENIMSMELFAKKIQILDSFNHLSSSLAAQVELIRQSDKKLKHTKKLINSDPTALEMVSRKGVFPYSYVTGIEILKSTKTLPTKQHFYDSLKETHVSDEDYKHAQKVWNHFSCKSLLDYMKVYLKADITLLADIMENYRRFFFKKFGLDPAHYISLPGLSYDCMLKYTGCEIGLIYDMEKYSFIKRSIRGGVAMIPHRLALANNPSIPEQYDSQKPITHLVYIDCNSLYSSVMTKKLPAGNLLWKKVNTEWIKKKIQTYQPTDDLGYLIECDLTYPPQIHDITADLPLAPEHLTINKDMISPYCLELSQKLGITMDRTPKLVSTQFDKKKYVCHIENLQFYLSKGLILDKVHNILQFTQKAVFEPYIRLCIEQRKNSTSPDEKQMWKLACNSIFGKTITNMEKRQNVRILSSEKAFVKAVASPRFKHADLIGEKSIQVSSYKRANLINSPYFIGSAILELSKLHLMKIHYNYFLRKYGRFKLKLCMTDTDSLLYLIESPDIYKDLQELKIIDFSNYPPSHQYHDNSKKGELFLMKDEAAGAPIKSFVGLRAKSYSILFADDSCKVTGKGVPRHKLKCITHKDLTNTLLNSSVSQVQSQHMRSYKHVVYTIEENKLALSPYDNKRYVLTDKINTLPIGHINTLGEPR